jgi:hypothetical protein
VVNDVASILPGPTAACPPSTPRASAGLNTAEQSPGLSFPRGNASLNTCSSELSTGLPIPARGNAGLNTSGSTPPGLHW